MKTKEFIKNQKMEKTHKKQILYLFVLILSLSFASASIEDFVNSLTFDYNTGQINITAFSDTLIDADSNGINDTLKITLTTSGTAGNYLFIAGLEDKGGVISSITNQTVSASDSVDINISTKLFSQNKFNYSIRIFNSTNALVYRKDKEETSLLGDYETGFNITSISDQNVGNDLIRLTLNMDVSDNETANITVFLKYNNSYISSTKEVSLTTPSQSEDIDFDNETIKETHYNGKFLIDYIKIGNKVIDTNKNTSSYNYETFAKTSYIKSFSDGEVDIDANNLSEYLQINITVNVKNEDTYDLVGGIYDLYDNYVANISKTQSLSTGNQIMQIRLNGSEIYTNKIDGPYLVKYAKLIRNSNVIDFVSEPHTTYIYYYDDFERPPLPDLRINISTSYNSGITNLTVNITNQGEAPAFNIFVDVFDNESYENQSSVSYLGINGHRTLNFLASNTSQNSVFIAIVDFSNYVDESNESNNVAQSTNEGALNLTISSLTNITINNTHMVFLFVINNTGSTTLDNINWTLDAGDGSSIIVSEDAFSLASGASAFVFIEYNYTTESIFIVNATANSGTLTASRNLSINLGNATNNLDVYDFSMYNVSSTHKVFQFLIKNIAENQNITDISWSLNSGLETVDSIYTYNLTPNNFSYVFIECNYTQTGDFTPIVSASSGSNQDSETLPTIDIPDIEASNLALLYNSSTHRIFFFTISNMLSTPLNNVNWTFDTDDDNVINASQTFSLNASKESWVFVEYNYSSGGTYNANATAINGSLKDSTYYQFTIS